MKKYLKLIAPVLLLLVTMPLTAQSITKNGEPYTFSSFASTLGDTLLYIILSIAILMLFLVVIIYYSVMSLRDTILAENNPAYKARAKQGMWAKIFEVNPTDSDAAVMLDHNYDNIVELNNPIPRWFMGLFYGTVVFAVVYLLNYHVFKTQKLQDAEYAAEIEQAEIAYQAYLKEAGDKINAETVTLLTDKTEISNGSELFMKNCVACHGKNAEGTQIAPNLTDEYWLHGGGIKNVFKTIADGVELKGMKSWKKDFSPVQIQQIASYVISLQGSNPQGGKEPQGEKWTEGADASKTDSTAITSMR